MNLDQLDHHIAALRDEPIPHGPSPQLAQMTLRRIQLASRRRILFGQPQKIAAALLLIFSAAAICVALNLFNRTSPVAFADVLQQLRQVRTVTYRTVTTQNRERDVVTRDIVDMAGKVSRSEILASPTDATIQSISIYNNGKILNLDPKTMKAELYDYTADGLQHQLSASETLADLLKLDAANAESLGEKLIDGKKQTGFRVNRDYDKFTKRKVEVWVDPRSRLPVRVDETAARREPDAAALARLSGKEKDGVIKLDPGEYEKTVATWPEIITVRIMTDIHFDEPVDDSAFSLDPPKGYTLSIVKVPG